MPKKQSYLTVTDQFCGAGGSSQGARRLAIRMNGGLEVKLALNHWDLAIQTHNTNFPDTIHDCTDISASDPRRYPSTDILITSPECTNHSLAKGQKILKKQMDLFMQGKADAAAERSRATMWDVPRFAEYHNYRIIIVENVVDARKWVMFDSWLHAMHSLGYMHKCVYHNSMFHHPTPQSRDRMYVVFWKKEQRAPLLDFCPDAYCSKCEKVIAAVQTWKNKLAQWGKYGRNGQYVYCCPVCSTHVKPYYYASFNCIDWTDIGKRIGDRKIPLKPNSIKRIEHGLDMFGDPFLVHMAYSDKARGIIRSVYDQGFTQTTLPSQAIISPFLVNDQHSTGIEHRVKSVTDQMATVPTQPHFKVILPFIAKGEHTQQPGYVKSCTDAMQTHATRQSMALITPYIVEMNSTGQSKPACEPCSTFTSGGINHALLNAPFIVENKGKSNSRGITDALACATGKEYCGLITNDSWNSFISHYYSASHINNHISDAMGTVSTIEGISLVSYQKPKIEDCYYRMLKPKEIKLAMAFDREYIVLGSVKDQVKQLGNAVTPPVMEWLLERCIDSLK